MKTKVFKKLNKFSNLILGLVTTVYVVLTFCILRQSKIQNENNIESLKMVNSAQIIFEVTPTQLTASITKLEDGTIRIDSGNIFFNIRNVGKTLAIPVLWSYILDSIDYDKRNISDSVFQSIYNKKFFWQWFKSEYYTDNHTPQYLAETAYIDKIQLPETYSDLYGEFHLHLYMLYQDVFGQLKDSYLIISIYFVDGKFMFLAGKTSVHIFNNKDALKFLDTFYSKGK